MATVFRKGKVWIAQWYRPDGSRVKRSTRSEKRRDAEKIAQGFEVADRRESDDTGRKYQAILARATAEAMAGRLGSARAAEYLAELRSVDDPTFRVVSLRDHLEAWAAAAGARVATSTASGYKDMVRRFLKAFPERVARAPVGELTPAQVDAALRTIAKSVRASTANLDLRSLRRAMADAVRNHLAGQNPAADVRPLPETDSVERAPFSVEEWRRMISHPETSEEWRGAILLAGHTGLRLGDVVRLGRGHVQGSRLVIRPEKTKRMRKTITVPLTPPCLAWIGEKAGLFFPGLAATATATLSMQFRAIMERAGVPAKVKLPGGVDGSRSFHSLRHSFASWLAEADIHADVRQKLTGHSSGGMHARYTHHDEALDRAIEVLPRLKP